MLEPLLNGSPKVDTAWASSVPAAHASVQRPVCHCDDEVSIIRPHRLSRDSASRRRKASLNESSDKQSHLKMGRVPTLMHEEFISPLGEELYESN